MKATEKGTRVSGGQALTLRVERSNLQRWLSEYYPVILVVYDAGEDRAWWVHVQAHFAAQPGFDLFRAGKTVTVHVPVSQLFDPAAVRRVAALLANVP